MQNLLLYIQNLISLSLNIFNNVSEKTLFIIQRAKTEQLSRNI